MVEIPEFTSPTPQKRGCRTPFNGLALWDNTTMQVTI